MHSPNFFLRLNYITVAAISTGVLILGIGGGALFFPKFFKKMVKSQLNLHPDTELRGMYMKVPFFLNFRIYMFNLLNPDEVAKGGKPKLQEVGPYFFEEWKEKYDPIDDDDEDTLTYHYKNTFIFRPDLSGPGLTGNEIITMPHPLIATMLLTLNVDKQPMIPLAVNAINSLFHNPKDMFWTGRVMDALFDGIPIDCSNEEDFDAKAVCSVFYTGEVPAVRPINDTHFAFSLFRAANGTDIGELKVMRGKKNNADIGKVVSFNGETEMDNWEEDECNQFVGTDSTIFPPYMDVNDGIWAWDASVCRSLGADYVGKSKYMGVSTAEFAIDISSEANSLPCFCREEDECPVKGTFDMYRCIGAPMMGSQPHFYGADPKLLENIESGINPIKEEHAIYMHFETLTGTPLSAAKRLQFNLEMKPLEDVPYMSEIREMYYPLFWVEEGAALEKKYVKDIKTVLLAVKIIACIKWFGIIGGVLGLLLAGTIFAMKTQAEESVERLPSGSNKIDVKSIEKSLDSN